MVEVVRLDRRFHVVREPGIPEQEARVYEPKVLKSEDFDLLRRLEQGVSTPAGRTQFTRMIKAGEIYIANGISGEDPDRRFASDLPLVAEARERSIRQGTRWIAHALDIASQHNIRLNKRLVALAQESLEEFDLRYPTTRSFRSDGYLMGPTGIVHHVSETERGANLEGMRPATVQETRFYYSESRYDIPAPIQALRRKKISSFATRCVVTET